MVSGLVQYNVSNEKSLGGDSLGAFSGSGWDCAVADGKAASDQNRATQL